MGNGGPALWSAYSRNGGWELDDPCGLWRYVTVNHHILRCFWRGTVTSTTTSFLRLSTEVARWSYSSSPLPSSVPAERLSNSRRGGEIRPTSALIGASWLLTKGRCILFNELLPICEILYKLKWYKLKWFLSFADLKFILQHKKTRVYFVHFKASRSMAIRITILDIRKIQSKLDLDNHV